MAKSVEQPRMLSPRAPMTADLLAETALIQPILDQFKLRRNRPRHRVDPEEVLVPEGYAVELVATGLNAPCHCCFDERGDCYISESATRSPRRRGSSKSTCAAATRRSSSSCRRNAGF